MALDGTKMAKVAAKFVAFAKGSAPLALAPVGGGTAIEFVQSKRERFTESTDSRIVRGERLEVMASSTAELASKWLYDGFEWLVTGGQADKMAEGDWPHLIELVRHA